MRRFRWNRKKYEHAKHLARLLGRFYVMPDDAPEIVQRYFRLWEEHPSHGDPLTLPIGWRYDRADIPF